MRNRSRRRATVHILFANVNQKLMYCFLSLMLVAFALVQVVQKHAPSEVSFTPPGSMEVRMCWQEKVDIDIDLWVQSPGDESAVGYSNKNGRIFNLVRDDMGKYQDETDINCEVAYTRGLPEGEYVINAHYYMNREKSVKEVPLEVVVSIARPDKVERILPPYKPILMEQGDQITIVRFTLDNNSNVDPNSIHDLYKELREWKPPVNH